MQTKRTIKFSVIIPVYNVAKYLPQCLESTLNQSYKNLEIIAVNDGSTDDSAKILEDYAKKDNRLKVIHQENGGVSVARNTGINIAQGEYIYLLDGDDYIATNMFEELDKFTTQNPEVDMVIFGNYTVKEDKVLRVSGFHKKLVKAAKHGVNNQTYILDLGHVIWNKLFKHSFLKQHNLKFPVGVIVSQDGAFCLECFSHQPKIEILPKDFYYYRIFRKNSAMASKHGLDKELLSKAYISAQPFYLNASLENKLLMDIKISNGLLFRYALLPIEKRLENLHYLEEYKAYLEQKYPLSDLKKQSGYHNLINQIKCKDRERLSFFQKLFSLKNSQDKQYKILRILGLTFQFKKK